MLLTAKPRYLLASLISAALFCFTVAGCSNPDAAVVGDWTASLGTGITTFKADHTVSAGSGSSGMTGTWSLSGKVVKLKPVTIKGKSIAEVKELAGAELTMLGNNPEAKKRVDDVVSRLDSGFDFTLSADGKTMVGTMAGQTQTLTKMSSKS